MKTINSSLVCFLTALVLIGCATTDPLGGNPETLKVDHKLRLNHKRDLDTSYERAIIWKLQKQDDSGAFGHHIKAQDVIKWSANTNFALVLPSTKYWTPTNGSAWSTKLYLDKWPQIFSSNKIVELQFTPPSNSTTGRYHYRIVVPWNSAGKALSDPDPFPDDSDPDMIDTTIIWDGGRNPNFR